MSKIGIQSENGSVQDFAGIVAKHPAAWLLLGNAIGLKLARDIRAASPSTRILIRTGNDWAYRDAAFNQAYTDNAIAVATPFLQEGLCDFLLPPNEPVVTNDVEAKQLNDAMVLYAQRVKAAGFQTGAYCFSVGNPDYPLWQYLLPGIRECGGWLFLHEYDIPPTPLIPNWSQWVLDYSLRHRKVHAIIQQLDPSIALKIGVTECLVDLGVNASIYGHAGGFRSLPDNGHLDEDHIAHLSWWDGELANDAYVEFTTIFGYSMSPRWIQLGFDVAADNEGRTKFNTWLGSLPSPTPLPPPPPMPPQFSFAKYPLPVAYPISQGFGENPAIYQPLGFPGHEGIDLACPQGVPVSPVAAGAITELLNSGPYGLHVRVDHGGGWQTIYAHLSATVTAVGHMVAAGEVIGVSGATGNVTGPHLHLTLVCAGFTYTDAHGVAWPRNVFDPTSRLQAVTPGVVPHPPPPPPPPTTGGVLMKPLIVPIELQEVGVTAVEGVPLPNKPFYRLGTRVRADGKIGGGAVLRSVDAHAHVAVLDRFGKPAVGVKVANKFRDGGGEILPTRAGGGDVQYNFGTGSAFSNPADYPFEFVVVDDAAWKDADAPHKIHVSEEYSDRVRGGDWQGEHTILDFVFEEQIVFPPAADLSQALRFTMYPATKQTIPVYNPGAALQAQARARGLGAVNTDEVTVSFGGESFVVQGFASKILYTLVGHYADADFKTADW